MTRKRIFPFALGAIVVLLPVMYLILSNPHQVSAAWYNEAWPYRKAITITNASGGTLTNHQVSFTIDTTDTSKFLTTCNDIRVADAAGTLLPHWIEAGNPGCGYTTTKIWTKIPSIPTTGTTIYVYYGNQTATNVESGTNVFEFFDDFNTGAVIDGTKWTSAGSPTVTDGAAVLGSSAGITSITQPTDASGQGNLIFRAKQSNTGTTGGKIGYSNTASGTHFNTDDAAVAIIGSTEEQVNQTASTNLISHHQLEETVTTDANQFKASGYLDTGKLSQAVSMYGNAAGTQGSTLTFNRGTQISGNNYEHFNENQGTISFWVKPSWNGNDGLLHYIFSPRSNFYISKTAGSYLSFKRSNTPGDISVNILVSSWTAGTWYHIVARWDDDNTIDGTNYITLRVNNGADTGNAVATSVFHVNANMFIGSDTSGQYPANALIDDFAIYDRVLTTTEIASLYNSGTGNEAGYVGDTSLKFYAKMDGTGTLSPVTYNGAATADQKAYNASTNTNGQILTNYRMQTDASPDDGTPDGWTGTVAPTLADAETANILYDARAQKITTVGAYGGIYQDFSVTAGQDYTLGAWIKSDGANQAQVVIKNVVLDTQTNISTTSSSWTYITTNFEVPAGESTIRITVRGATAGQTLYVQEVSITPNSFNNGGLEGTYVDGVAPNWVTYGGTGTYEDSADAHSGSHAQKITHISGSSTSIRQDLTLDSNTSYLVSFWAKRTSGASVALAVESGPTISVTSSSWTKYSGVFKPTSSGGKAIITRVDNTSVGYFDDLSITPLDNTALSFKAWTPVNDTPGGNSAELVTNGTMEADANWVNSGSPTTNERSSEQAHNGTYSKKVVGDSSADGIRQSLASITAGKTYRLEAWVYVSSLSGSAQVQMYGTEGFNNTYFSYTQVTGSWVKLTGTVTATSTEASFVRIAQINTGTSTFYVDDVSVKEVNNPLSVHGGASGVASTTSGARGNSYTFDGSTGYLRQKTYAMNIGTLSYLGNDTTTAELSDDGQTFTSYATGSGTAYAYMVVVTNSDNTTSWGYLGASDTANHINIHTAKGSATRGWNGTAPVAGTKTAVGYEIRKTDYQITGNLTVGAWVKSSDTAGAFISKNEWGAGTRSFELYFTSGNVRFDVSGTGSNNIYVTTSSTYNDNNWHYIVGVYNTSTLKIYVDGVDTNAELTGTVPGALSDISSFVTIGDRSFVGNNPLTGSIDSPFVIASALTADQIKDIYNSTASHYGLTTNNATVNNGVAASTATNATNTYGVYKIVRDSSQATLAQNDVVVGTSSSNLPNSDMYVRAQNADTANTLSIDWIASYKYASTQPTAAAAFEEKGGAPVLYWKLDETSGVVANDSGQARMTTSGNNGTVTAPVWLSSDLCIANGCLQFNGTTTVVTPASNTVNVQTVALWIKPASAGLSILDLDGGSHILSTTGGVLTATGFDTVYVNGRIGTGIATNRWNFIEATTATPFNTVNATLGKIGGSYFNGFMDDFKLFAYAKTAAQVKADYAARGTSGGVTAIDTYQPLGSVKIDMVTGAVTGKARALNTGGYLDFTNYLSNVTVNLATGVFSGYAFFEDAGWVAFGTADNAQGPVQLNRTTGVISGKAKVLNTGAYIDFDSYKSAVSVNLNIGATYGYAFGEDTGWLAFGVSVVDNPPSGVNVNLSTGVSSGKALGLNTGEYLYFTNYNGNVSINRTTGIFSGYGFSQDIGWVAFGTVDNSLGPVRYNLVTGAVTGKAKVLDTGAYLDFTNYNSNVVINLETGAIAGHVFSEDAGWFYFGGTTSSANGSAVIFFKFDEGYGSTANNGGSGGTTYNGTLNNTTWTTDGKEGKGVNLDGTSGSNVSGGDVKY